MDGQAKASMEVKGKVVGLTAKREKVGWMRAIFVIIVAQLEARDHVRFVLRQIRCTRQLVGAVEVPGTVARDVIQVHEDQKVSSASWAL